MNHHPLLSASLVALFFTGCDKPKPDISGRIAELEKRVAAAEQETAEARAAQQETERMLEEQRLAVQRDALARERIEIERQRAETERAQQAEAREAEEELRDRETALENRETSVDQLQDYLAEQQKALDERAAELSEKDKELAGREELSTPEPAAPEPAVVDVRVFYEPLSSFGTWFDSPSYGYVWRPHSYNTAGWRPYSHGRWVCTDRGWMWVSDEPFGWATYHYGRWALCRINGWIWVPGNEWAPSWVCWRSSGTHVGWAPLPPETMAYRGRNWDSGVEIAFGIGSAWFCFVETRYFCSPIRTHCLPHTLNDHHWHHSRNITNIHVRNHRVICGGPSYGDIERQTDRRPPFYRIEEERSGRAGRDRYQNRIEKGRIIVTPPRREESRNPDAVQDLPPRIGGRLDQVDVVRTKPLNEDVVRDYQKIRDESRRPGGLPREISNRPPQRQEEAKPDARGEEQRRLNERAQDLEIEARKEIDDRIRVLPRPASETSSNQQKPNTRGEEQRRLNEKAQDLEKEARKNTDDRIRVLPRSAEETMGTQQQRAAEEAARRQAEAKQEAQRLQQQRAGEEAARRQAESQREAQRQQRAAEEASRRQAEAQRETQRQQQQRAAEEAARRQAESRRQMEEQQRRR